MPARIFPPPLLCLLLLLCCLLPGFAQDDNSRDSLVGAGNTRLHSSRDLHSRPYATADDTDQDEPQQLAVSAERLVQILRENPNLVAVAQRLALKTAQQEGAITTDDSREIFSEDALIERIEQDADFRFALTRDLTTRGYLPSTDSADDTAEDSASQGGRGKYWNSADSLDGEADRSYGQKENAAPSRLQRQPASRRTDTRSRSEDSKIAADPNQPDAVQRRSPYRDLPSLRDLYRQIPAQSSALKRFGIDVFRSGTGNTDKLPMDLPAGPDYVLGPGDGLTISLWGSVSQRFNRTVDRQGQVALPEAGVITLAGQTMAQAQQSIQRALSSQFREIKVDVSLTRLRTVRVYVVGDVEHPGPYDVSSLSTPLNALYAAGGPTARGSLRTIRHLRGQQLVREVDLYDFLLRGMLSDVRRLESGDTILVPPVGPQVTVAGMVRRPAIYELKNEKQLAEALDLAGGVLVSATLRQIDVERIEAHQRRTMLSLNLPESNDGKTLEPMLTAFSVQDGDRITISPILPYSDQTVYLQGHVFRPGKYPYRKGMTVADVVRSYQDLMPEPADHAEVVRLVPPDYRPMVIEFHLGEILSGDDPVELQPFDTIRVFGRYEIDAPKVSVYGEVLRPGKYPLAQGMTAAELVRMAGGFKRSALTQTADIASYVVQNGQKILTKHSTVEIAKALAGDGAADVTLKPGDVLTIRQLTGWKDIGGQVTVSGEVMYAGTYGIQEGERLSALLKRAGGFRETAYPAGAVLEREQVRELAEKSRTELIHRIQSSGTMLKFAPTNQDQNAMMQAMVQQQQQVLATLRNQPATGRLVINISPDISKWENTPADIELRAGDVLAIPKRPTFVLVNGQVYNASAITYTPGKTARWYLQQAGGATDTANKKAIFVIRANGSVIGAGSGTWWKGNVLSTRMQPGDTVVVPDKIIGRSLFWRNLLDTAQLSSSLAIAARVATSF